MGCIAMSSVYASINCLILLVIFLLFAMQIYAGESNKIDCVSSKAGSESVERLHASSQTDIRAKTAVDDSRHSAYDRL